jgi:hypothetical protein
VAKAEENVPPRAFGDTFQERWERFQAFTQRGRQLDAALRRDPQLLLPLVVQQNLTAGKCLRINACSDSRLPSGRLSRKLMT